MDDNFSAGVRRSLFLHNDRMLEVVIWAEAGAVGQSGANANGNAWFTHFPVVLAARSTGSALALL